MQVRHAQIPHRSFLEDAGLQWPGAGAVMSSRWSAGLLAGTAPANDVVGPARPEIPAASEENLLKVVREYRRLFGSAQPRARLSGEIGRLILGRRARPTD